MKTIAMHYFSVILSLLLFVLCGQRAGAQTCTGASTRNIVVENCTSTASPDLSTLRIFPNPASDVLVLQNSGGGLFFELFNLTGSKILEKELPANTDVTINVRELPAGIYLAKWHSAPFGKTAYKRIEISK